MLNQVTMGTSLAGAKEAESADMANHEIVDSPNQSALQQISLNRALVPHLLTSPIQTSPLLMGDPQATSGFATSACIPLGLVEEGHYEKHKASKYTMWPTHTAKSKKEKQKIHIRRPIPLPKNNSQSKLGKTDCQTEGKIELVRKKHNSCFIRGREGHLVNPNLWLELLFSSMYGKHTKEDIGPLWDLIQQLRVS